MLRLSELRIVESQNELGELPKGKVLINTINAHSYNVAQKDELFAKALSTGVANETNKSCGDYTKYLVPDGASIIKACRFLKTKSQPKERIAGWDLFIFEMNALKASCTVEEQLKERPVVMFVGSTEQTLEKIVKHVEDDYPMFDVKTYSPPYKEEFSSEDKQKIIDAINEAKPSLLWFGLTAPKQEKLVHSIFDELQINCHVGTIGAVFDFYSGNIKRAPMWFQEHSLEWFYRFCQEPLRLWKRYTYGNLLFAYNILKEKFSK